MMRSVPGDPEKLGGYWLAGRLGAGRHGVVYDAYDERGRRFAIRVPRGPFPRVRPVAHPHLASVLEVCPDGAPGYVVTEFAGGRSLREAVSRHGPYAGEELVALAGAVASALACLHAAGLCHGDLRPGKVLLTGDGPRVICPGVPGSVGAARTYLAPEVVTGGPGDARADVFAWGALVLFAATGEDPFRGRSMGEVMHRLLSCDPDVTPLPPRLRGPVSRALAKDPSCRPLAADLRFPTAVRVPPLPGPPALGEVAEELYASLAPGDRDRLRELLVALASGEREAVPELSEAALARLLESGLLIRPSVAVPPTRTPTGTLVAVTGGSLAPATAALYHAWPRLRGWLDRPSEEASSWARTHLPRPRPLPIRAPAKVVPATLLAATIMLAVSAAAVVKDPRRTIGWLGEATAWVAPAFIPDPPPPHDP